MDRERERGRDTDREQAYPEKEMLEAGIFPRWPQCPGWARPKPRAWNFIAVFHVGGRCLCDCTIFCFFPRCIGRKPDVKWSSQDYDMGYQCSKQQHKQMHHNSGPYFNYCDYYLVHSFSAIKHVPTIVQPLPLSISKTLPSSPTEPPTHEMLSLILNYFSHMQCNCQYEPAKPHLIFIQTQKR